MCKGAGARTEVSRESALGCNHSFKHDTEHSGIERLPHIAVSDSRSKNCLQESAPARSQGCSLLQIVPAHGVRDAGQRVRGLGGKRHQFWERVPQKDLWKVIVIEVGVSEPSRDCSSVRVIVRVVLKSETARVRVPRDCASHWTLVKDARPRAVRYETKSNNLRVWSPSRFSKPCVCYIGPAGPQRRDITHSVRRRREGTRIGTFKRYCSKKDITETCNGRRISTPGQRTSKCQMTCSLCLGGNPETPNSTDNN